jgi:hypothetical protein
MTRQNINVGTTANDGTGDTLRQAGQKMNQNFQELYQAFGGNDSYLSTGVKLTDTGITFEGQTVNGTLTTLAVTNPTGARTVTLPNASGIVVLDSYSQTLTNKTLTTPVMSSPKITAGSYQYTLSPGTLSANTTLNLPSLTTSDTIVVATAAQTLEAKTLTNAVITAPKIGVSINDTAGAQLIVFNPVANAVNEIAINNNIGGANPSIEATGADTNVSLELNAKGAGAVIFKARTVFDSHTLSSAGAALLSKTTTILNGGSNFVVTLPDGNAVGLIKYFINKNSGTATIQPDNLGGGQSSFTIDTQVAVMLMWTGAAWYIVSKYDNA